MKIENGYLVFDKEELKRKKITGSMFPTLIGYDGFKKKGTGVISRLGFLDEKIDPYYLIRGNIAEEIVNKIYIAKGYKTKHYSETDRQKAYFDNFRSDKNFGGFQDIDLLDIKATIEVKGKSMKDYEKYNTNGNIAEEVQGDFYAYLKGETTVINVWVFFSEEQEKRIKEGVTDNININECNYVVKKREIDLMAIELLMDNALNYYNKCLNEKRIPLNDIDKSTLEKLGLGKTQLQGNVEGTKFNIF